uniref:Uncharacterized protein n=1 Tax=Oryza rufipogon TaxID=4529 RepID=A0A0E0N5U2_ORYRU
MKSTGAFSNSQTSTISSVNFTILPQEEQDTMCNSATLPESEAKVFSQQISACTLRAKWAAGLAGGLAGRVKRRERYGAYGQLPGRASKCIQRTRLAVPRKVLTGPDS